MGKSERICRRKHSFLQHIQWRGLRLHSRRKIYIDPRIATAETPIHEYAHLWATAMREGNPTEWKNIVGLMKGTSVWAEVQKLYPELKDDDDIADEVLATFSGRRGAERLRAEQQRLCRATAVCLKSCRCRCACPCEAGSE